MLIVALEAQVGHRDEYGDYPAAGALALGVVAALTIVGLYRIYRSSAGPAAVRGDMSLA